MCIVIDGCRQSHMKVTEIICELQSQFISQNKKELINNK